MFDWDEVKLELRVLCACVCVCVSACVSVVLAHKVTGSKEDESVLRNGASDAWMTGLACAVLCCVVLSRKRRGGKGGEKRRDVICWITRGKVTRAILLIYSCIRRNS